ncbi:MAG: thymidine phosphorylase [Caldilineae bacterium]|nr:MAG: thymidine phosphorylase [Caldilineae bacterium]
MRAVDIIAKKRDGQALSAEEIDFFIQGYARDEIPDYQAAAWCMAVLLRGMTHEETTALTLSMARSGKQLDLSDVAPLVADKHSTGGVGDKVTMALGPVVAAAGQPVGKMSGRGLGFSGGTLDKLESIPGWSAERSEQEFKQQIREIGLVVAGQTRELVPADRKLYALRDVTATVPSLPLIASSVMSKKIAAGANVILLDVKVGVGAFMETLEDAVELAETMVAIGRLAGRRVAARVTDMNQPLGRAVGNALEVKEALATLRGEGPPDFTELILTEAAHLLMMCERADDEQSARRAVEETLSSGTALEKFRAFVAAQGGDPAVVDEPDRLLPQAPVQQDLLSPRAGYLSAVNARVFGMTTVHLGGGRLRKGDPIDRSVGVVLHAKIGDYVEKGQPLCTIHARNEADAAQAAEELLAAYDWSEQPVSPPALIKRTIQPDDIP